MGYDHIVPDRIQIFDFTGQHMAFEVSMSDEKQMMIKHNLICGFYLMSIKNIDNLYTRKLVVE